jgi:hypothetical protein
MKILDIIIESKQPKEAPKPRNFVAKNAMATTSGAGAHRDRKKEQKQGYEKHKNKGVDEGIGGTIVGGVSQFLGNKIDPLAGEIMRAHGEMAGRKAEYTIRKYMHLLQKALKQQLDPETNSVNEEDWGSLSKREFKRREMEHELGHEDTPEFKAMMRERDRGPWYIKIDGEIFKQKGEPKVFDWRNGANNYALAIIKNKPELQGKIMLTKRAEDDLSETAPASTTTAANVAVGAIYKNKPAKQAKNKDGTAKNALDMKANLMTGGSIKR